MLKVNQLIGFGRRPLVGSLTPTISFIGAGTTTGTTLSVPGTEQAGDLILICDFNQTGTANPTTATDFTSIRTDTIGGGGEDVAHNTQWRYATSGADTIAGIGGSGSDRTLAIVLRGTHASAPIGDHDADISSGSTTINLPALTLADSRSWVVAFFAGAANSNPPSTPSGMTVGNSGGTSGFNDPYASWYIGPVSSFATRTATLGTSVKHIVLCVEILAA